VTQEKRLMIQPRDILAIEYGCPKCKARHAVPIANFDRTATKCPNCFEPWVREHHTAGDRERDDFIVANFVKYLREIQGRDLGGAVIRLEVGGEA